MALHPNPLTKQFMTGVIKTRPELDAYRAQYLGSTLLPKKPVGAYKLTWDVVSSENNLAGLYAINGVPVPGSELPFASKFSEAKNVMASRVMHAQDVMILREPGKPAVGTNAWNMRKEAQDKLRKKAAACDDEVDSQIEYMQMHALQGEIVWPPVDGSGADIESPMPSWGDVQITISFPLRAVFQQAATTLSGYNARAGGGVAWTDPSSDPILDLEVIAHLIERTIGVNAHGSKIIMGGTLLSYIAFNTKVLAWVQGTEKGTPFINTSKFQEFLKVQFGYELIPYNANWTYRSNITSPDGPTLNTVPFLRENRLIVIPPGVDVGYTASAPAPDGTYKPGKYTWHGKDVEPPYEDRVGVGEVVFPILERADQIFIFDADL